MSFELLPHTADIRMHVVGHTREEFYRDALLGMVAMMKPSGEKGEAVRRTITIEAPDETALLIDFFNEALVWMHTKHEAYTDVRFTELSPHTLSAELAGYTAEEFSEDIKAATYHEVEVAPDAQGNWSAVIVFDI